MIDRQAIPEANKRLGELLGFTVRPNGRSEWEWLVITPNDGAYIVATEQDGWLSPQVNFYSSVDACLAVLPETYHVVFETVLTVKGRVRRHNVTLMNPAAETTSLWYGKGATRSEALANALLQWAQAKNGDAP